ncbi:MAG TPA: DUF2961 domain-containing protein [Verrucomicrobiae bacterium]|nr:DUF2961 domain-containing protein [Verrucomicrobiae bacterium]
MIRGPVALMMLWCALVSARAAADAPAISTATLLYDLTNLSQLAEFPAPAYTCRQFSSWDRASKSPTDGWFANGDCGQYLRTENISGRTEFVMMDAEGPGAIVRIWSANPDGVMRIYIDGEADPALEAGMKDLLGGKYPGLPRPIAGEYSRGWNLYFPIPYARRCKITSDKGKFYYHVNYRTYAHDTKVVSFKQEQIGALRDPIESIAGALENPDKINFASAGDAPVAFETTIAPGETGVLGSFEGPAEVKDLALRWNPSGDRDEPVLRAVLLEIMFDGETTVAAPLGDFFGSGPGVNPFDSLPLQVSKDGRMQCKWVMPFRKKVRITAKNLNKGPVALKGSIAIGPRPWTDRTMLFHAKWRIQHDVPTDPKVDWNYIAATGMGVFVGVAFAIDNPVKEWWGEGDEKIYVDGERFPSHFGTGTEDYYGYAWCSSALFTHAFHNQTRCDGPRNFGRTSVNRFHIIDRIPFQRDFRFDMELWHWKKCLVNTSVMNYWYAAPGGTDNFSAISPDHVALRPPPALQTSRVPGAIECEGMRVIEKKGQPGPQEWDGTSGERHLWWKGGQGPGDTLVIGFNAPTDGRQKVFGRFLKARDYGIAKFAINGHEAGGPIDFYNDRVLVGDEIELGTFDLKAGENTLSVTIVGANEKAVKSYMVGIDYLMLKPAE